VSSGPLPATDRRAYELERTVIDLRTALGFVSEELERLRRKRRS
jgi:hypothetical protein